MVFFQKKRKCFGFLFLVLIFCSKSYAQYEPIFTCSQEEQFSVYENLFHTYIYNTDFKTATAELDKITALAKAKKDKNTLLKNDIYRTLVFYKDNKLDSVAFTKKLQDFIATSDEQTLPICDVLAHIFIGQYYFDRRNYLEGFAYFSEADDILEKNNLTHVGDANELYFKMSMFFYNFKSYEKALEYSVKGTLSAQRDGRRHIQLYNIKALCYAKTNRIDSAMSSYEVALELAKKYGDTTNVGVVSGNIGQIYKNRKEWDKAIPYIQADNILCARYNEWGSSLSAKMHLVNIFIQQGKLDSAKKYIDAGEPNTHKLWKDDYNRFKDWYEGNAQYYTAVGNYQKANLYKDSILYAIALLGKINTAATLDEAQMNVAVQKYTSKLAAVEQNRKRGNMVRNIIAISLLLVCIIIALLFRHQLINRRQENELALQKETLFNIETEKREEELAHAGDLLDNFTKNLSKQDEHIEILEGKIQSLKEEPIVIEKENNNKITSIDEIYKIALLTEDDWQNFKTHFENIHKSFFASLKLKYPALTPAETRLLALLKLKMSGREMASTLAISPDSVKKAKQRLNKKLNITDEASLQDFVNAI
jgi:DNA-binding CsgD family transcriptional regulator/Tfp pilus assembly protein PilF